MTSSADEVFMVAVSDVWDALTSDRAYRKGWPMEEALAHIDAARGTHFDPGVVDALIDLAGDWGLHLATSAGDPDEAWEAAQTCHQTDDAAELASV